MAQFLRGLLFIYRRTSTKGQRDEKTIDAQIARAKEAIRRDAVTLLAYGPKRDGWVKDDGVSGSLLAGRAFAKRIDTDSCKARAICPSCADSRLRE